MTIQEAINHAKEVAEEKYKEGFLCYANSGDVENDKKNDECVKCAKEHEQLAKWLEKLQQYRVIGTVEECQEARERQRAKKPVKDEYNHDCCPDCGWIVYQDEWGGRYLPHCENCGQAIDWSE